MKITNQLISSFPVLSATAFVKASPKVLLAIASACSLTLAACSTSAPSASSSTSADSAATEATTEAATEATTRAATDPIDNIYTKENVAIGGADPVAYFNGDLAKGEFVEGSADFTYEWKGATWQFASAENRDTFAANPEQYAPEYGGYCAWAAAQDKLAAVSPDAWSIVDNKLYLNANKNIQTRWEKDIPGFISKANENWPSLSTKSL